jgi:hypothetical protein
MISLRSGCGAATDALLPPQIATTILKFSPGWPRPFAASRARLTTAASSTLGTSIPLTPGGARLRLSADSTGHAVVQVRIRTGASETAEFLVPVEPAAIDAFVRDLAALQLTVGATARLPQET